MGQQQLLLIILGVIVVGIAVAVGITMFTDNAVSSNRDAVASDLVNLAARAQQYYRRPLSLGGGGQSFTGLTIANLTNKTQNSNGTYSIVGTPSGNTTLHIKGVGVEKVGSNPVQIETYVQVQPDSVYSTVTY
jgi:Tfp pilus assembly protein PilE